MGSAPTHRRFSRNVLAAYATERMREVASIPGEEGWARYNELQRLYDRFELSKDRRRPPGGTLTRYDG